MKYLKYFGIGAIILGFLFSMAYYIKTNSRSAITYETSKLSKQTIEEKIVATGSVVPEDEVNIVPQISGIIDEIFVEEGDEVVAGDLLAKIKVVPNEQSLNSAEGRVKTARIVLNNSTKEFDRNKKLFDKGVISEQDFNSVELRYNQDQQNLENALSDLQIIRLGSVGGSALTNTNVRSTVSGTVLQVPVKEGDQAIEANTFNPGTTIATVADLNKMIFEGRVDEGEVGKLEIGMDLKISLGAIEEKEYDAKLTLIAPKGIEVAGAIQFKIEGEVSQKSFIHILGWYPQEDKNNYHCLTGYFNKYKTATKNIEFPPSGRQVKLKFPTNTNLDVVNQYLILVDYYC